MCCIPVLWHPEWPSALAPRGQASPGPGPWFCGSLRSMAGSPSGDIGPTRSWGRGFASPVSPLSRFWALHLRRRARVRGRGRLRRVWHLSRVVPACVLGFRLSHPLGTLPRWCPGCEYGFCASWRVFSPLSAGLGTWYPGQVWLGVLPWPAVIPVLIASFPVVRCAFFIFY